MASLSVLRSRVNDWLSVRWPALVDRQETYLARHGRYWQGLITHASIPAHTTADDNDAGANRWSLTPSDQVENWGEMFQSFDFSAETFPAALRIDVYEDPRGHGWQATIFMKYNNALYTRSKGVGPLAEELDHNWMINIEE